VRITTGTIVDATILHAPASTKNREQQRDPSPEDSIVASVHDGASREDPRLQFFPIRCVDLPLFGSPPSGLRRGFRSFNRTFPPLLGGESLGTGNAATPAHF
jgi:hypothetical protein